jgi:hypothetical protein
VSGVDTVIIPRVSPLSGSKQGQRLGSVQVQAFNFAQSLKTTPSLVNSVRYSPQSKLGISSFPVPFLRGNGNYSIQVRRFGKFKTIGSAKDLDSAIDFGESKIRQGLGATFRVLKGGSPVKVKAGFGFYSKGFNVIEKARYRLNTSSEVSEIGFFNKNKRVRVGL